jgi:hypothetical protein
MVISKSAFRKQGPNQTPPSNDPTNLREVADLGCAEVSALFSILLAPLVRNAGPAIRP